MRRFLTTDASLTYLLVSLFVLLFVLYPLVEPRTITSYALEVLSLMVLISGAYTVSDRRGVLFLCIGLAPRHQTRRGVIRGSGSLSAVAWPPPR